MLLEWEKHELKMAQEPMVVGQEQMHVEGKLTFSVNMVKGLEKIWGRSCCGEL
jgi:hypothetical protein